MAKVIRDPQAKGKLGVQDPTHWEDRPAWCRGVVPAAGEYRATVADCYGHAEVVRGGDRGRPLDLRVRRDPPVRIRLVWDFSDPEDLLWRNEMSATTPATTPRPDPP